MSLTVMTAEVMQHIANSTAVGGELGLAYSSTDDLFVIRSVEVASGLGGR